MTTRVKRHVRQVTADFGLLSHPTRFKALAYIAAFGQRSLSDIADHVRLSRSATANLLRPAALRGFVHKGQRGNEVLYTVDLERAKALAETACEFALDVEETATREANR